jgi:hypothetical protein
MNVEGSSSTFSQFIRKKTFSQFFHDRKEKGSVRPAQYGGDSVVDGTKRGKCRRRKNILVQRHTKKRCSSQNPPRNIPL